jgi:hypothetical protein
LSALKEIEMGDSLPNAKSATSQYERDFFRRIVAERSLVGLANDTKWNELIFSMRSREGWTPSYRCKCLDGVASDWDSEWFYHLPFPMLSVEWLDISHTQEIPIHRLPPRIEIIDHSSWISQLLKEIGLDYHTGERITRVFGYAPRNYDLESR